MNLWEILGDSEAVKQAQCSMDWWTFSTIPARTAGSGESDSNVKIR